jgi:uncharacterized protein YjhX (UPF0386 family)
MERTASTGLDGHVGDAQRRLHAHADCVHETLETRLRAKAITAAAVAARNGYPLDSVKFSEFSAAIESGFMDFPELSAADFNVGPSGSLLFRAVVGDGAIEIQQDADESTVEVSVLRRDEPTRVIEALQPDDLRAQIGRSV